ncbi:hypothetical protein H2201_008903 [Coniosporium apollinis]|uniref:Histidine kinase n=1 Tax=Coniosporium apollinis TaxID=61459 RepID=A0ABQ9NF41_9PEZI|nr:hypothetical protein H2201_008903 [Coniosporium apollinis]
MKSIRKCNLQIIATSRMLGGSDPRIAPTDSALRDKVARNLREMEKIRDLRLQVQAIGNPLWNPLWVWYHTAQLFKDMEEPRFQGIFFCLDSWSPGENRLVRDKEGQWEWRCPVDHFISKDCGRKQAIREFCATLRVNTPRLFESLATRNVGVAPSDLGSGTPSLERVAAALHGFLALSEALANAALHHADHNVALSTSFRTALMEQLATGAIHLLAQQSSGSTMAAGTEATDNGVHAAAAVDGTRARELYKYYQPARDFISASQSSSPDTVLTAHAQLVAWRLNTQRALISLCDRDTQYFIGEGSKTLSLDDTTKSDDPTDALWAGCVSVPKAGRLCEYTIQTHPPPDGGPAYFEVLDCSKDERFSKLPFVSGAPGFRYYVGVPIRTKRGVNIGSLFAIDDKVREPLSESKLSFLSVMADNIMTHLETAKERDERKRALHMNMCLAAFVDPEHQIRKRKRACRSRNGSESQNQQHPTASNVANAGFGSPPLQSNRSTHGAASATGSIKHNETEESSVNESEAEDSTTARIGDNAHLETFKRASDLLRDSLFLHEGGGVVFMDSTAVPRLDPREQTGAYFHTSDEGNERQRRGSLDSVRGKPTSTSAKTRKRASQGGSRSARPPADILALSHGTSTVDGQQGDQAPDFTPLAAADVAKLIRRYPHGKLFTFDVDDRSSPSSGEDYVYGYSTSKPKRKPPSQTETQLLLKHFHGARQIMFFPLWDSVSFRWSAFFAYNTSDFRTLTHNPDFLYCIAFCNCVMTEVARIATLAADQQKSDFIGSISHELRSPLHGILASCEFLADTDCNSFQRSLVDTADSCARTLLDTINMVLDYSRINAFERNVKKARKSRRELSATSAGANMSSLNIYGNVDLATLTEEVVEGIATGQVFKDFTSADVTDLAPSAAGHGMISKVPMQSNVEMILDISPRAWTFVTQPGAFRRIVMNLFGNALKYTKAGFIILKLVADELGSEQLTGKQQRDGVTTQVTLTITDSGQGISPEYMRTNLFTPFSQESSINPGTGLGLSLVRQLVNMLNGEIKVHSTLGVGTEVVVTLPMAKSAPSLGSSGSSSTPSSAGSTVERTKDDSISIVKENAQGRIVTLFFPKHSDDNPAQMESARSLQKCLKTCLSGWLDLPVAETWLPSSLDIVVVNEADIPALLSAKPQALDSGSGLSVLVLSTNASRHITTKISGGAANVDYVSKPIGPIKLARALRRLYEKQETQDGQANGGAQKPEATAEEATVQGMAADVPSGPMVDEVVQAIEKVTLRSSDGESPDIPIIRHGSIIASEESSNAQMALEPPGLSEHSDSTGPKEEFPFPMKQQLGAEGIISPVIKPADLEVPGHRPPLNFRRTLSPTVSEMRIHEPSHAAPMTRAGADVAVAIPTSLAAAAPQAPLSRSPRLLLVDDNKVNLRLLHTFMRKRRYADIYTAEDGVQAVNVFRDLIASDPPAPPGVCFMDVTMPLMNGFEATREIRDIEAQHRAALPAMQTPAPCLIVALTGLASSRDQSEAFTSGMDLYMTKPVSFREVGGILDNWEANGGAGAPGVPHGAVTGQDATNTPA